MFDLIGFHFFGILIILFVSGQLTAWPLSTKAAEVCMFVLSMTPFWNLDSSGCLRAADSQGVIADIRGVT